MFARKLIQDNKPTRVYKLRDNNGNLVTHPQEVLKIFTSFYKALLSSPQGQPSSSSRAWLDNLQLPSLNLLQIDSLNEPCTDTEIIQMIKSLKTSTAPGPDGYTTSYYKKCASHLAPNFTKLFNHILEGSHFPEEMLLANMSLIPNPHKDHSVP